MEVKVKVGRQEYTVKENLVDRAVRYFNPVKGKVRLQSRIMTAVAGGYAGGSKSRRSLKEWTPLGNDADSDLLPDLPTLRGRSRDLVRNSPLACGAINTAVTSVIGPGLTVKPTIDSEYLGLTEEQADTWEKDAKRLWNLWANSQDCDLTRTQNFNELQSLAFRSTLENGDIFSLLPYKKRKGSPFGLKVQFIEADRVENEGFAADSTKLAGGVELDSTGAPVVYHILKTHPGNYEGNRDWQKVRAFGERTGRRNVIHLFDRKRPGQNRGIPYLAPVIETLKQLERYSEAELMAAVVSGMFTVFIKTEGDGNLDSFMPDDTGASESDEDYKLDNGAIVNLDPNDDISTANPGRPNSGFDPFVLAILRQVGVALEIPYEILVKHFTASYSAARAAMLEAWRFFLTRRVWMTNRFCQPVYEAFITEQVAEGRLIAPGFFADPLTRQAYLGTQWTGRPQGQIDPLKENNADVIAEEHQWKTASQITSEKTGNDWEQNVKQAGREENLRKEMGIKQEALQVDPEPEDKNKDKPEEGDENT